MAWQKTLRAGLVCAVAASFVSNTAADPSDQPREHFCAPELRPLGDGACLHVGEDERGQGNETRTLVIFLHSLIGANPGAAWEQQRRLARMADVYGFTALIPRGRPGLGPGRDPSVLGWPTALELQERYEAELLGEWSKARRRAEKLAGPFERVFVFGFSNGAYYAETLAFRERLPMDGVALFAGGSGSKYQLLLATRAKRRIPLFLGYGTEDPDSPRQVELRDMLRRIDWPHRTVAARVGHTVSDDQIRAALAFLGHPKASHAPSER